MRKGIPFMIGLVSVPVGVMILLTLLIPIVGIPLVIIAFTILRAVYRALVGPIPPIPTKHDLGFDERKRQHDIVAHGIRSKEVKMSFSAGVLTSFFAFAVYFFSMSHYADKVLPVLLIAYTPIYLITMTIIISVLVKLSKVSNLPEWATDEVILADSSSRLARIADKVVIAALGYIPLLTLFLNKIVERNGG